jgi:hypothetical protein
MRAHYDFARMKARKNPYVKRLKKSVTILLAAADAGRPTGISNQEWNHR